MTDQLSERLRQHFDDLTAGQQVPADLTARSVLRGRQLRRRQHLAQAVSGVVTVTAAVVVVAVAVHPGTPGQITDQAAAGAVQGSQFAPTVADTARAQQAGQLLGGAFQLQSASHLIVDSDNHQQSPGTSAVFTGNVGTVTITWTEHQPGDFPPGYRALPSADGGVAGFATSASARVVVAERPNNAHGPTPLSSAALQQVATTLLSDNG